jgi:hypothetical protein
MMDKGQEITSQRPSIKGNSHGELPLISTKIRRNFLKFDILSSLRKQRSERILDYKRIRFIYLEKEIG